VQRDWFNLMGERWAREKPPGAHRTAASRLGILLTHQSYIQGGGGNTTEKDSLGEGIKGEWDITQKRKMEGKSILLWVCLLPGRNQGKDDNAEAEVSSNTNVRRKTAQSPEVENPGEVGCWGHDPQPKKIDTGKKRNKEKYLQC